LPFSGSLSAQGESGSFGLNGRVYETIHALRQARPSLDLYHTALEVEVPDGRFTIENAWPSPNADFGSRGVVLEGPVFSRRLGRFRPLRYEVRAWRDGTIPDIAEAVASPQIVSQDPDRARKLLSLVPSVPPMTWGRDEIRAGEIGIPTRSSRGF
jgi:hypothetical protein